MARYLGPKCRIMRSLGMDLSLKSSKVNSNKDTRILWTGPNAWLVMSKKENISKSIKKNLGSENFAITDISHSRRFFPHNPHILEDLVHEKYHDFDDG